MDKAELKLRHTEDQLVVVNAAAKWLVSAFSPFLDLQQIVKEGQPVHQHHLLRLIEQGKQGKIFNFGEDFQKLLLQATRNLEWLIQLGVQDQLRYLKPFQDMLGKVERYLEQLLKDANPNSRFHTLVTYIHRGERGNAGMRRVRQALNDQLTTIYTEKWTVSQFYNGFVKRYFVPELHSLARLYLIQNIPPNILPVQQTLEEQGVDRELIISAYKLIELTLQDEFDVRLHTVKLFDPNVLFDPEKHEAEPRSYKTLAALIPEAQAAIQHLPPDTIYDLTTVGLEEPGNFDKPRVVKA